MHFSRIIARATQCPDSFESGHFVNSTLKFVALCTFLYKSFLLPSLFSAQVVRPAFFPPPLFLPPFLSFDISICRISLSRNLRCPARVHDVLYPRVPRAVLSPPPSVSSRHRRIASRCPPSTCVRLSSSVSVTSSPSSLVD